MSVYADTSFVASLYMPDVHAARATAIVTELGVSLWINSLLEVELCNAIELRVHRKWITLHAAQMAHNDFAEDIRKGVVTLHPLSHATFEEAKRLSRRHTATLGTRSLDLMHVASAVTARAATFLSFDRNQRKLAEAAGLTLVPQVI